ncbi:MAG: hypothetical protein AAGD10_11515 [Myxococcota bacterium]
MSWLDAMTGLRLSLEQLQDVRDVLSERIGEGLDEAQREIACLPAFLPPPPPEVQGEALVLDLGGTNIRAALVAIDGPGQMRILAGPVKASLRGGGQMDADTFLGKQAELITSLDLGSKSYPLGYVFSFPARVEPDADAVLLRWTKGLDIPGVVGTRVGARLAEALRHRGVQCRRTVVLNDTVACLIGGAFCHGGDASRVVGLIAGTGTNMAGFVDAGRSARLRAAGLEGAWAVNFESGNFHPPHLDNLDEALDQASLNPGAQRFEKAVSGYYLPKLLARAESLDEVPDSAAFLDQQIREVGPYAETSRLLFERSADLVAAGLAAVFRPLGPGRIGVLAEGSLFWSSPGYEQRVQARLSRLCDAPQVEIFGRDDINFFGAAAAALTMA